MEQTATDFLMHVRPHWGGLHRVAGRYTGSGDDARDLVQETLLRAWRNYNPGEERSYDRAWLFVIMRSVIVDWQRKARRRIKLVVGMDTELTDLASADLTESFSPLPSLDESRFREFLDDRLVGALDRLEPAFREIVMLSAAGDLSYREIAEVLDCPVGTVMSRMARARRSLREALSSFATQAGWIRGVQS